jgi:cytochrome c oxidase cbb3-type subunit III
MSDFTSPLWPWFIAITTVLSIGACAGLLWWVARKKIHALNDNTTGHIWDEDLVELNHPMPRWWMGLFVVTIVFAVGYLVLFPGLGAFAGLGRWSSVQQHTEEVQQAKADAAPVYARLAPLTHAQLAADPEAMAIAGRLFLNHCAQCHGSDARGSRGFPDLTDRDWLWGGDPEQIRHSITEGRNGVMPALAGALGSSQDVLRVADFVLSLSSRTAPPDLSDPVQAKFAVCAACHGANGGGNPQVGAPNLRDDIWLHGSGRDNIVSIINKGKNNAMPAQKDRLTPAQIQLLTAYVWRFSNSATRKP